MPYAHLDDRYDDHRKTKRAWRLHPASVGLHAMAISYCNRHQTDGKVDAEWVEEKLTLSPLKPREREAVLDALLEVGMFERDGEDFVVHDFLEWNRSRAQRQALADQGRRGGHAKASANGKPGPGDGSGPGSSQGQSDGFSEGHSQGSTEGSSTPLHASPRHANAKPTPSQKVNTEAELRSALIECFAYWQERCEHPQATFTDDRRRKLLARLKERAKLGGGVPRAIRDVRQAIDGAARGAFVNPAGKRFDDLELICRTGTKLEDFMDRANAPVVQLTCRRTASPSDLLRKINESEAS